VVGIEILKCCPKGGPIIGSSAVAALRPCPRAAFNANLDMNDRSLVLVMTQGIGAHLTNDEKRAHLTDLKREHLIDQVCIQEILPPEQT
jgi:hypothetical protein